MAPFLTQAVAARPVTVSVVIAFYNAAKFLAETIESVCAQTYQDWELLLVDDGSTDSSATIADTYAQAYPDRMRSLHHPGRQNLGAASSRNLGFRHTRGRYIALLDADDLWLPQKLSEQVRLLEEQPQAGMLCGAVQHWFSWNGQVDSQADTIAPTGGPQNALTLPPLLFRYLYPWARGMAPSPSDLLFRRVVLEKVGGFEEHFRHQYQLYDDQSFLNKVYLYFPVYISSTTWTKYRIHPESCMATVMAQGHYHPVRHFFLQWFEQYLLTHGQQHPDVWSALQTALAPYL